MFVSCNECLLVMRTSVYVCGCLWDAAFSHCLFVVQLTSLNLNACGLKSICSGRMECTEIEGIFVTFFSAGVLWASVCDSAYAMCGCWTFTILPSCQMVFVLDAV